MQPDPEDAAWIAGWRRELQEQGRVELRVSDTKVMLALLVVPVAIGLFFWMATSADEPWALIPAAGLRVIGWAGIPLVLLAAVPLVASLAVRGPAVVIDHEGVHTCHRPRLSLRWDEIHGAAVWQMAGHGVLLTVDPALVREWQAGLDRQSRLRGRLNRTRVQSGRFVLPSLLTCPSEPLATWLTAEAEARRAG